MKKSWLATFLTLALLGGIFAPGLGQSNLPKTKEEFVKAYVRYLSQEEASRWVKTQGKNFVYIGSKELFPGLGALLKGREVKVFVGEGVREIPWLEKAGVRYSLVSFPGQMFGEDGLLLALEGYLLGREKEKPQRLVLVPHKEVAGVLYRMFSAYEAFGKVVKP